MVNSKGDNGAQGVLCCCDFYLLILAVLDLGCCVQAFSHCGEQGLLSNCDTWASHGSGFSYFRAWALGHHMG